MYSMKRTMCRVPRKRSTSGSTSAVVDAALHDAVELDRRETRRASAAAMPASTSATSPRPPDSARNVAGIERIEADREALQAGLAQRLRPCRRAALPLVVSARSSMPGNRAPAAHQLRQVAAQQRFAAGQAQLAHAEARRRRAPAVRSPRSAGGRSCSRNSCRRADTGLPACSTDSGSCSGRSPRCAGRAAARPRRSRRRACERDRVSGISVIGMACRQPPRPAGCASRRRQRHHLAAARDAIAARARSARRIGRAAVVVEHAGARRSSRGYSRSRSSMPLCDGLPCSAQSCATSSPRAACCASISGNRPRVAGPDEAAAQARGRTTVSGAWWRIGNTSNHRPSCQNPRDTGISWNASQKFAPPSAITSG